MSDNLNPQIREIDYGVRSLRKLTIYPMSMSDQKKFGAMFQSAVEEYLSRAAEGPITTEDLLPFAKFMIDLIGKNMKSLLKIITDLRENELDTFFDDVTNDQMSNIINAVYEENFGEPSKKLMSLMEVANLLFPSEKPSQPFLNDTANGISATSTQEASEKED